MVSFVFIKAAGLPRGCRKNGKRELNKGSTGSRQETSNPLQPPGGSLPPFLMKEPPAIHTLKRHKTAP
jgi:hypothetical protein